MLVYSKQLNQKIKMSRKYPAYPSKPPGFQKKRISGIVSYVGNNGGGRGFRFIQISSGDKVVAGFGLHIRGVTTKIRVGHHMSVYETVEPAGRGSAFTLGYCGIDLEGRPIMRHGGDKPPVGYDRSGVS